MSITDKTRRGLILLTACIGFGTVSGATLAAKKFTPLNEAEFEKAKGMYFQRCAGCHGVLLNFSTFIILLPLPYNSKIIYFTLNLFTKLLSNIINIVS